MALGRVSVAACRRPGGPFGQSHVVILFAPDGTVLDAHIDAPSYIQGQDFRGTETARCVEQAFRAVRIPPFAGAPVKVGKSFTIPTP